MSPEDINAMCTAAMVRLTYLIDRAAGQHLRAMRNQWSTPCNKQP